MHKFIRLAASVALTAVCSSAAGAQTFFDGNFTSGWSSTLVIHHTSGDGGSGTTGGPNGNPGAYWETSNSVYFGFSGVAHIGPFGWDPSTQGAITSLALAYDVSAPSYHAISFLSIVRQNGHYFRAPESYATVNDNAWFSVDQPSIALTGWCEIYASFGYNGDFTCGPNTLDFSASGGLIEFGVESANSGPSSIYGTTGGIDNFAVTVNNLDAPVDATPEPATLLLFATGLAAVAGISRNRRRASPERSSVG